MFWRRLTAISTVHCRMHETSCERALAKASNVTTDIAADSTLVLTLPALVSACSDDDHAVPISTWQPPVVSQNRCYGYQLLILFYNIMLPKIYHGKKQKLCTYQEP